jgi:hypothetical protein
MGCAECFSKHVCGLRSRGFSPEWHESFQRERLDACGVAGAVHRGADLNLVLHDPMLRKREPDCADDDNRERELRYVCVTHTTRTSCLACVF